MYFHSDTVLKQGLTNTSYTALHFKHTFLCIFLEYNVLNQHRVARVCVVTPTPPTHKKQQKTKL